MTLHGMEIPQERLAAFCRENGIRFLALFGHKVDLNTPGSLSKHFRAEVLQEAEALYDAA